MPKIAPPMTRFEEHHIPEPNTGCWLWLAQVTSKGYGCFWFRNYPWRAHRAAWVLFRGEIPEGVQVLHRCDNPSCVNPEHLFLGTNADNMRDRDTKGRANQRRGEQHPYATFTEAQVHAIRADPRSMLEIAAAYGRPYMTIYQIVRRHTWRWL